jgi:hypothetical protein
LRMTGMAARVDSRKVARRRSLTNALKARAQQLCVTRAAAFTVEVRFVVGSKPFVV